MKKLLLSLLAIASFFTATAQVLNNHKTDVDNPYSKPYE
jgi:uncharacterized protein YxeA